MGSPDLKYSHVRNNRRRNAEILCGWIKAKIKDTILVSVRQRRVYGYAGWHWHFRYLLECYESRVIDVDRFCEIAGVKRYPCPFEDLAKKYDGYVTVEKHGDTFAITVRRAVGCLGI